MTFFQSRMTEIAEMTREEVIEQLEQAGFACYDHETTEELKDALIQHEKTEWDEAFGYFPDTLDLDIDNVF